MPTEYSAAAFAAVRLTLMLRYSLHWLFKHGAARVQKASPDGGP
jgi:hypothetical protein